MPDGTRVSNAIGTLTWTPDAGGGGVIGFTADGFNVLVQERWIPITPEELVDSPEDFIRAGGLIYVMATAWQWDAITRAALAPYFISGNTLVWDLAYNGRLASEICQGTLAFAPTARTGKYSSGFTHSRALALMAASRAIQIPFRRRKVVEYSLTWGMRPDANLKAFTLNETSPA